MARPLGLVLLLSAGNASCPNDCSGHGICTTNNVCECYQNWQSGDGAGGDCSDRTCAYDIAWADVPHGEDDAHYYAECSARGICNRKSGLCECFDGYTGKACRRNTCPNDCSGHGTCDYLADVAFSAFDGSSDQLDFALKHHLLRNLWDQKKTRLCVCDPMWTDVDCSRRMCPRTNDVLNHQTELNCDENYSNLNQVQRVCFNGDSGDDTAATVALVYSDLYGTKFITNAIAISAAAEIVQVALRSLPDHALELVTVSNIGSWCEFDAPTSDPAHDWFSHGDITRGWEITFRGPQVPLLDVLADTCTSGCQTVRDGVPGATTYSVKRINAGDKSSFECSRRGKCDYSTGTCECVTGFTDDGCSTQATLV